MRENKKNKLSIILILLALSLTIMIFFLYANNKNNDKPAISSPKVSHEETKYENINVYTKEEWGDDQRSLLYVSYPVTENKIINLELEKKSQLFIDEYKNMAANNEIAYQDYLKETGEAPVSLITEYIQHFDISFTTEKYLLFIFDQYRSTGGTGSANSVSLLFNRITGEELALSNLFSKDNYLEELSSRSRKILNERMNKEADELEFSNEAAKLEWRERGLEQIDSGTKPVTDNFNSLIISENRELVIVFDKYQVGPGSDGVVTVKIPLSDISAILSEDLRNIFDISQKEEEDPSDEKETIDNPPLSTVDCSVDKCVALTFDDGPSVYTNKLLDILKEKNVKASFFVLGRSAKIQADTIKRIFKEGHVIGNHSWDHKNLTKLSEPEIEKQIADSDRLIKEITGYEMTLLRPPYGSYKKLVQESTDKAIILWNIDPEDWKVKDAEIVSTRMSEAEAGSIILAHDIYPSTIEAIPQVIENLKQKGLKFVTINELFAPEKVGKGQALRYRPY